MDSQGRKKPAEAGEGLCCFLSGCAAFRRSFISLYKGSVVHRNVLFTGFSAYAERSQNALSFL